MTCVISRIITQCQGDI